MCVPNADYDGVTTSDDLSNAIIIAGHHEPFNPFTVDALQLDMVWPSGYLIKESIKHAESRIEDSSKKENSLEHLKIILQVGSIAMEILGNNPQRVANRIAAYGNSIHYVLFDRSGGLGKKMNTDLLCSYISKTKETCPNISIAVAGGLGPDTINVLLPLVEKFPDISIDAQGKLRKSGNALYPIDWDLAKKYLEEAGKLFA